MLASCGHDPRLGVAIEPITGVEQAALVPPEPPDAGAYAGERLAIDGDTAALSSQYPSPGSVVVYVRSGTTWSLQQVVTASDGDPQELFGTGLALSGDTMFVASTDLVYVFERSGDTWAEAQKLPVSPWNMALSGDTAILGTSIYTRSGGTWSLTQALVAPDLVNPDDADYGYAVALSGDTALIGAVETLAYGTVYVFVRDAGTWTLKQELVAPDGISGRFFGSALGLSGDTMVVGASALDYVVGEAYVFVRQGGVWTEQASFMGSDPAKGDSFGYAAAVSGDIALVGDDSLDGTGLVHVFQRSGTAWPEQPQLVAAEHTPDDGYGLELAFQGTTAIVGAARGNADVGGAYVFVFDGGAGDDGGAGGGGTGGSGTGGGGGTSAAGTGEPCGESCYVDGRSGACDFGAGPREDAPVEDPAHRACGARGARDRALPGAAVTRLTNRPAVSPV